MNSTLYTTQHALHEHFPTISFSTNVYDNPPKILESIIAISGAFDAIEFEIGEEAETVFYAMTESQRCQLAEDIRHYLTIQQKTLTVHAGWYGAQYDLCHQSARHRAKSVTLLQTACRFAYLAGAKTITFHPGYLNQLTTQKALDNLILAIQTLNIQQYAPDLLCCLENMGAHRPDFPIFSTADHQQFHQQTGAYITIDVTHLCSLIEHEKLNAEIKALTPIVKHLHIADMKNRLHAHLPLGKGNLSLTDILNQFAYEGYQGVAVVEEFVPRYSTKYYFDQAIAYHQHLMRLRQE